MIVTSQNGDILPEGTFCEFDYKGLLQGSPAQEIDLLIKEVGGPILDVDEARAKLNLGAMPKQPQPQATGVPANG